MNGESRSQATSSSSGSPEVHPAVSAFCYGSHASFTSMINMRMYCSKKMLVCHFATLNHQRVHATLYIYNNDSNKACHCSRRLKAAYDLVVTLDVRMIII